MSKLCTDCYKQRYGSLPTSISVSSELAVSDIGKLSVVEVDKSKVTGLQDALNAKQNNLTFTDDYAADTSVVATKKYVDERGGAKAGPSKAKIIISSSDPRVKDMAK